MAYPGYFEYYVILWDSGSCLNPVGIAADQLCSGCKFQPASFGQWSLWFSEPLQGCLDRSSENVLIAVLPNKCREFQVWQFLYGLYVKYVCLDNPKGPERGQPGVQFSGDETGRLSRQRAFTFPSDLTVLDRSNGTGS